MEQKNFHITYGVVAGLICVVLAAAFHVFKVPPRSPAQYILYLPFAVAVIMACINFGKANDNYVTFGKVFSVGFKTTALFTLIMVGWMVISFLVFPEMKEQFIELSVQAMKDKNVPDEQMEKGMEMMDKFYYVTMIGGTIFGNMVPGLIFSLIGAGVTKKNGAKPPHIQ